MLTHILHHYIKTSNSRDRRVPTSGVFMRGSPRIKKRQYRGTPTGKLCRGAPCGYPGSTVSTSILKLVQDLSLSTSAVPN